MGTTPSKADFTEEEREQKLENLVLYISLMLHKNPRKEVRIYYSSPYVQDYVISTTEIGGNTNWDPVLDILNEKYNLPPYVFEFREDLIFRFVQNLRNERVE